MCKLLLSINCPVFIAASAELTIIEARPDTDQVVTNAKFSESVFMFPLNIKEELN
jgi:hypothetical protein